MQVRSFWCIIRFFFLPLLTHGFVARETFLASSRNKRALPILDCRRVFFDLSVASTPIGRLVFKLAPNNILPLHVENFCALCTGEKVSIDPKLTYIGCAFEHSPMYVEGSQYKWCHVLKGNGRNTIGRPTELISDPAGLRSCIHDAYGGSYYGLLYDEADDSIVDGVLLVVPIMGPGRGSSRFNIVRVGDSPRSWGKRLLLNQAVIGTLESGGGVLRQIARQKKSPPTIIGSGLLDKHTSR